MTFSSLVVAAGLLVNPGWTAARVLEQKDREEISRIESSFASLTMDFNAQLQRADLSSGDTQCMRSALGELFEISKELSSYRYLITIETELNDVDNDTALKSILRFAVDKAIDILDSERKRMSELSDECSRFPLSSGKVKQAVQFLDGSATTLKSIQSRL